MLEQGIQLLHAARTLPLEQGLAPVIEAVVVMGSLTIGIGVWIARALTRSGGTRADGEQPFSPCRRHDWLRVDDGGYVCVRCSYRAGL